MKSGQRRPIRDLSASVITFGFLWTDMSQWGDVLIWVEAISKPLFLG